MAMNFAPIVSPICCDGIRDKFWFGKTVATCFATHKTLHESSCTANDAGDEVPTNSIKAFSVEGDKRVSLLPYRIHLQFSKLEAYDAGSCSICRISKYNFEQLSALKELWLRHNLIEEIFSDTFEDLTSLEYLALGISKNYDWGL